MTRRERKIFLSLVSKKIFFNMRPTLTWGKNPLSTLVFLFPCLVSARTLVEKYLLTRFAREQNISPLVFVAPHSRMNLIKKLVEKVLFLIPSGEIIFFDR